MTPDSKALSQEGYEAYEEGEQFHTCPYDDDGDRYWWELGWMEAREHHYIFDGVGFDGDPMDPIEL